MRCFVAVEIGPDIAAGVTKLADAVREIADACGMRVSWTRPEGWHVTLSFLGEISEEQASDVAARLHDALAGATPFRMTAAGVVTLPPRKAPRVLAVDVDGGTELRELAAKVAAALEPAGFAPEKRPFRPHLTIGRVRGAEHWRRFLRLLEANETLRAQSAGEREVASVELLRSELGPGGSRYTVLESFPLGTSAAGAPAGTKRASRFMDEAADAGAAATSEGLEAAASRGGSSKR